MMKPKTFTIQVISEITDLPHSTLRYYEEIGLLEPVARANNGHRRYSEADLRRIEMIKKLRRTGMTIDAMRDFVALYRGGTATATQRREILEAHRQKVQAQVDEMLETLDFIDYKIGLYKEEEVNHEVSLIGQNGAARL